jgi:DNA (cytosine-5)-methyltransferase 1
MSAPRRRRRSSARRLFASDMKFVSLFAGVGGFDLGLERAGHECIAQVEIDKHCRTVLDRHWPDIPKHNDVRTAIEFADTIGLVGRTDLVCGGFPCQDVSVAGKRAGLAGERTGLFWDALAFTTHVQARWLLLENVPGLLTSNQGRDFGTILLALDDAGLPHIEWKVLDSQFFGVPQRRRRVFLVASAAHPGRRPLLTEWEGCRWDPAAYREAWQASARAASIGVGTGSGAIAFNWQNGGGYGNANPGLGITEDGTGPLSTSQVPAVAVDFRHTTLNATVTPTPQAKSTGGVSLNYLPGVLEVRHGSVDEVAQGHEPRGLRDMEAGGGVPHVERI